MRPEHKDEISEDEFDTQCVPCGKRTRQKVKTHLTKKERLRLWEWKKQRDEWQRDRADDQVMKTLTYGRLGR